MIHVIATITVKSGARDDFLAEFRRIIEPVRAEDGCLEYGPTVDASTDVAARRVPRADVVTVVEKWASVEHLERHLDAPHMNAYRERVKDLVVGVDLVILEPA